MNSISLLSTVVLALSIFAAASVARAQPETGGFMPDGQVRSENQAVSQALINTIMPIGVGYGAVKLFDGNTAETLGASLAIYGLVVGPSSGNFYANDYLRGGLGALTRLGAAFLLQDATSEVFGREFADALGVDNSSVSFSETNIVVGSTLMVGTIAYNIITAPVSVREYNREMGYTMEIQSLPGTGRAAPVITARIHL
ncbi:hypothetical protein [Halalkalibaculum sp. DA384]|uniref:hypothetical protein n=1 Tax=Halalkalibaculum sp. DA384 TaxID=3373606 RepID=UPI0037553716